MASNEKNAAPRADGGEENLLLYILTQGGDGDAFRPIPNQSVTDRIIQRLTDALMHGQLLPGQKIPTEVELSESMRVSRNSVREAIKVLVSMGVLEIRRSEGTFVCERFSDKMLSPLIYGLIIEGGGSSKIIELRRIFDMGIMQQVIEKAGPEDIRTMRQALRRLKNVLDRSNDAETLLEADIAFHKAMENSLKNPLVEMISVVIERLTRPTRLRAVRQFIEQGAKEDMYNLHAGWLQIIDEKDTSSIARAMDDHYKNWKTKLN